MINVTIQNPAKPEQVHHIPMKDLSNAMCALLSLKLQFRLTLLDHQRPLMWIDTQEVGVITHLSGAVWIGCKKAQDGRWLKDGLRFSVSDLTDQDVVISHLPQETIDALPSWIYTWNDEVDL